MCVEAFAQGKMLNNIAWRKHLPRNITPSDIDFAIDNNGIILIVEFSSQTDRWDDLKRGQRLLYENLVWAGCGNIKAALAFIRPQPGVQIDTVRDVISFSLMCRQHGEIVKSQTFSGKHWQEAVVELIRLPSKQ